MTQKESLLEVYLDVDSYLQDRLAQGLPVKESRAVYQVLSLVRRRINTLNKQIEEYQGKLKRNAK